MPTLMVASGDDTTTDTGATVDFFCDRIQSTPANRYCGTALRWTNRSPQRSCEGVEVIDVVSDDERFVSHSHVGITIPPSDPHYGLDGNYAQCLAYQEQPAALFFLPGR